MLKPTTKGVAFASPATYGPTHQLPLPDQSTASGIGELGTCACCDAHGTSQPIPHSARAPVRTCPRTFRDAPARDGGLSRLLLLVHVRAVLRGRHLRIRSAMGCPSPPNVPVTADGRARPKRAAKATQEPPADSVHPFQRLGIVREGIARGASPPTIRPSQAPHFSPRAAVCRKPTTFSQMSRRARRRRG